MTKQDWIDSSLKLVSKNGADVLKIDILCKKLKVTKGSFYHHFKNRSDFINSLMIHWYEKTTLAFIKQANTEENALERLNKLDQVIATNDIEAEMHLRAWGLKEPSIVIHLEKIDDQRQSYLQSCFVELGMDVHIAKDVAMIAYAQLLGLLQLHPKPSKEEILRLSGIISRQFFTVLS
mgnify:CR=1 FL=1